MTRDQLLRDLSKVSQLVEAQPWWQRGMLDEHSKSTCDTPRPVQLTHGITDGVNHAIS
jgi:hypothetical protein